MFAHLLINLLIYLTYLSIYFLTHSFIHLFAFLSPFSPLPLFSYRISLLFFSYFLLIFIHLNTNNKIFFEIGGSRVLPQSDPTQSPDPYNVDITHHLYRNSLYARLSLPHRYTAMITVDVLGLREVDVASTYF